MFGKLKTGLKAYKLWGRLYDLIKNWGRNVPQADNQSVVVGVKSAATSKVNWLAAGGIFISAMELLGQALSQQDQQSLLESIKNAASWEDVVKIGTFVLIIVVRTWFTRSLTKASVSGVREPGGNAA